MAVRRSLLSPGPDPSCMTRYDARIRLYLDPALDLQHPIRLPPIFQVTITTGRPARLRYPDPAWGWGPTWQDWPLIPEPGTLYVFPQAGRTTHIRGGAWRGGASIMVCPGDTRRTLNLRATHELLHLLDDGRHNPDRMEDWIAASTIRRILYRVTRRYGLIDEGGWQHAYYQGLIDDWRAGRYTIYDPRIVHE